MKKMVYAVTFLSLVGCGGGGSSGSNSNIQDAVPIDYSSSISNMSSSSNVSSSGNTPVNKPLALGSGTLSILSVDEYNGSTFVSKLTGFTINEETGALARHKNTLTKSYAAADIDPSGMVIAVFPNGTKKTTIDEIDLIQGTARTLFSAPEELSGIAVGSDGVIVCVSSNLDLVNNKLQVYRFNKFGVVLSKVAIDPFDVHGIDFDKNGILYGVGVNGLWKINPVTGASQHISSSPASRNDIDIDSNNTLRLLYDIGALEQYSLSSGTLLERTFLQLNLYDRNPLNILVVHR